MRHRTQQLPTFFLVALALALLASSALASPPPSVTFNLTGVGAGNVLAGVYTSPYSGNINGGTTIPVICDDFGDDSYVPETWKAYQTQVSSLVSGTPDTYLRWVDSGTLAVDGYNLTQAQAYTVAAVLATDILQSSGMVQEDYSYALWELFDSPAAFNQLAAYGDTNDETNANNYLNNAVSYVVTNNISASAYSNVTIYSYSSALNPNGPSCGGGACASSPPQEFITVSMAEPSSIGMLGLDLLGVVGLVLLIRRRWAGSAEITRS